MCVAARTCRSSSCTLKDRTGLDRELKYWMLEELRAGLILVVEDVRETSDGIERLLKADGYRVALARDELEAIESAKLRRPDLILVGWTGLSGEVLATVGRIRERAAMGDRIPVVFWVEDIDEGEEVAVGGNVHLMRPDSFNQLRGLLARLLDQSSRGRDEFAT
jgi:CheY-like chemotaxis protein